MAKKFKVFVFEKMKPGSVDAEKSVFKEYGLDVDIEEIRIPDEDEFLAKVKDADALIGGHMFNRRVIEAMPNLKHLGTYSVGYDGVDVQAATDNGVVFCNNPATEWCVEEVSNQAIVLLMTCAKKVLIQDKLVRQNRWIDAKRAMAPMGGIHDQVLGLVGCGAIARMTAEKALALRMKIIGYDPYLDPKLIEDYEIQMMDLESVLKQADYVSVHTPLTDDTYHLLGEKEFRMMKPSAYFINTARGPVVDEKALIKALQEGWIMGAGLDVFEKEPMDADNPLMTMENVVLIPHSASFSDAAIDTQQYNPARQVARTLSGFWPKNPINPEVKPKLPLTEEK